MRRLILNIIGCALCLSPATTASAETHALLIGVSDYETLDADLKGPANDVVLMAHTLHARGVGPDNIRILASDGVTTDKGTVIGPPRRADILAALRDMAGRTAAGDDFLLYFSGHGSQAPDQNGDESGGMDEILLPADAGKWTASAKTVPGAIVDDEWHGLLQPFLDKGVRVVGIIDACHSSTGFRALGHGVARYVDPSALGVPDTAAGETDAAAQPGLRGDYVFLYSAQSDERAFEYPIGDPANAQSWHGDFTRNLSRVLMQGSARSWGEVLVATKNAMRADGPAPQTPAGEGPLLSAEPFGTTRADRRIAVENGVLQAGLLHGIRPGTTLHLSQSDATATVAEVTPLTATLRSDQPLPGFDFARIARTPPRATLPISLAGLSPENQALARQSLPDTMTEAGETGAHFWLAERDGGLALANAPGGPFSAPAHGAEALAELLLRAQHLHRVRGILADLSGTTALGFALPGSTLGVDLSLARASTDCADHGAAQPASEPLRTGPCDQLWLAIHNPSQTARDVTVLFVDKDHGITPIWPDQQQSNRILFGETETIGMQFVNDTAEPVLEEIILIAAPAADGQLESNLTYLSQPDAGQSRAARSTAATQWFDSQLEPETAQRGFDLTTPEILVYRYTVHIDKRN